MSSKRMRPELKIAAATATFAVLVAGVGGVAIWKMGLPLVSQSSDSQSVSVKVSSDPLGHLVDVSLEQGQLTLACAPGVIDPATSQSSDAESRIWQTPGASMTELDGGGTALEIPSELLHAQAYGAAQLSGELSGDLASLLLESCVIPSRDAVMASGSTEVGDDTVLILSNPGVKPVQAQIQVMTPIGPALDTPVTVPVAAQSTVTVLPAVWAPGESRIGVRVQADGLGVAAWLQNSTLDGELPLGLSRIPSATPSNTVSLIGVDPATASRLRVVNAGTEPTTVKVTAYGVDAPIELGGTDDLVVEAMGVFDLQLQGLPEGTTALTVEGDQPIAASVLLQGTGNPFVEDNQLTVGVRAMFTNADSLDSAVFPSGRELAKLSGELGYGATTAELVMANLSDEPATVTVGTQSVELAAGRGQVLNLSTAALQDAQAIGADSPVYVALRVTAESPIGLITSVQNLRQDVAEVVNRQVLVFPSNG